MPWKETGPVFERHRFIADYSSGCYTVSELAARYGVSRRTLYKWIARFEAAGDEGLVDRSRRPSRSPCTTPDEVVRELLAYRQRMPTRGPKKIVAHLAELRPDTNWPAPSTAGDILRKHGLVPSRTARRTGLHPAPPPRSPAEASSDLTTIDFKGQFRLGNRQYCYPLTIVDAFSRYILACEGLTSTAYEPAREVFERVFRTYGLPRRILSDNGSPFASTGLGRLSRLALWWTRLDIKVERTSPGHPEQNGSHERMHRTMKQETTRPPAATFAAQQRVFDRFRDDYNNNRPHEGLGQKRPVTLFVPSPRPYPRKLPPLEYPGHYEIRKADDGGLISWNGVKLFLSSTLAGEHLGLEQIDDHLWSIYYGTLLIARFDERERKIYG